MSSIEKQDIVDGLKELGLSSGHHVLVHSSLSSFGHVIGGAEAVIDALLECVGGEGTVLVPTLTGHESLSPANPPVFDVAETPCWTGRIPETFRRRLEAVRSQHATHSVAAIGARAEYLTRDHVDSVSPCDDLSPYGNLARTEKGRILLIGVDHECSTVFHHVEEAAGLDYHLQNEFSRATIRVGGREFHRHILLHRYGTPRCFNVMEPLFVERGIQASKVIGKSVCRLVNTREMVAITLQALKGNPRLLCRDG